jgi:hypothetical protein
MIPRLNRYYSVTDKKEKEAAKEKTKTYIPSLAAITVIAAIAAKIKKAFAEKWRWQGTGQPVLERSIFCLGTGQTVLGRPIFCLGVGQHRLGRWIFCLGAGQPGLGRTC